MTKRFEGRLQRWLCLMLVLAMMLSLVACGTPAPTTSGTEPSKNMQSTSSQATQPTTPTTTPPQPTTVPTTKPLQPSTPGPTVPPQPEFPPIPDEGEPLVYTLVEDDVTEYYQLLEDCEELSIEGLDMDAIDVAMTALDEKYEYLNAQYSIANLLYYSAMSNETLKQQYLDTVEICTQANDAYIQMARRVYQSDTPAKDVLFEGWTPEEIAQLLAYDERIAQLQQRNSEIKVEYQNATDDAVKINLYIEFVQNNNEIASFYGYDNYYEYAYELVYDRDYTPDELVKMRQFAKQYLADAIDDAKKNFEDSYYSLDKGRQNSIAEFLYYDYDVASVNYLEEYLENAAPSIAYHTQYMMQVDSLFVNKKDAMEGAFTTMIGDRSFCYFGPGYANSCTVIHEAGHYYASRYADLEAIPLDLAETHSQGHEWLFVEYLKNEISLVTQQAIVDYRLYNDLAMIMICLMVDEFEQRVYTTDLTGFTAADFDAIMEEVCTQYFTMQYCNTNLTNINAYWRLVVVEQPVYYISYAVSSVAALDLFTVARQDYNAAVAIYQKLCEEPVLEAGFQGNIIAAGLAGPFDESFYQELAEIVKRED